MITTKGYYFGYKTVIAVISKHGKLTMYDGEYEINSDDTPTPSNNTFTKYNLSADTLHKLSKGDHVIVYSGPTDLYGITGEGNITKIETTNSDGKDQQTTVTFQEGTDYSKNSLKSNFNGVKTVKQKKGKKKVNISFKKGAKAKEIITKVAKVSGIKIYHLKLAKNKIYKRGYTVSNNPYNAIKQIVKDCKSAMYYRKGKLVIDDNKTDNPYHEHLYLSEESGMYQEPSVSDDDNSKTYTLNCFDDPRLSAGSSVQISSKLLNGLYRVKSVKHTHQNNYEMEVVVYAKTK
ncbi:hypothetical protein MOO46_07605 (plasmid) [Apilactobacillus apisilvae]|uniref:Uncharacterized protein n=1 Tax=Apilactobacillus apisilvae TaxID=2923364 RepID=A0ABY4PIY1_9LACO|nr:hypothetical protein [Apilactobacillus apisilvae]UQS85790.1 hypothetical protein MOO46_07605 [Apilactobacillus apisilvae]